MARWSWAAIGIMVGWSVCWSTGLAPLAQAQEKGATTGIAPAAASAEGTAAGGTADGGAADYAWGNGARWRVPTDSGFSGGIFATPLPPLPQTVALPGGPLAAPVVLPALSAQGQALGQQLILDTSLGRGGPFDPATHPGPAQFVFGETGGPRRPWVWAGVELLLGSSSGVDVPPLITSGPTAAGAQAGAIGSPSTTFVFGERKMLDNWRPGLRAELGMWFGDKHQWGLSARYYSLYSTSDPLTVLGDGTNVVVVPQVADLRGAGPVSSATALTALTAQTAAFPGTSLITSGTNVQLPLFVSYPGVAVGSAAASVRTSFAGGDANLRRVWMSTEELRWETFIGYRQLRLGDELRLQYASTSVQTGLTARGEDNVRTSNNFYGAQIGTLLSVAEGPWSVQLSGATALGNNACDVDFTYIRLLGAAGLTVPLAFSDSGNRINYFSVVSEANLRVGLRVSPHTKFTFGYTGLYWWNVARAQTQYTLSQNLSGRTTGIYLSMLHWGMEMRY